MEVKIVLGHAFGDEGKGVTVQYLCKQAIDEGKKPLVIRFSGGPQAAHTIQNGGITHICSTFGSGVLLGVPTLITTTAYFDPICAQNEWGELVHKMGGINNVPPLFILPLTPVITPYDVFSGRNNEKVRKDGTCGKGIYPTFKRSRDFNRTTIYETHGFYNPMQPYQILHRVRDYYETETLESSLENNFANAVNNSFYSIVSPDIISLYDVLIFEGSQGLLLDMDNGYFPNVTPSKVGLNGIPEKFLDGADLYLVTRTYLTRHGNGYKPSKRGFNFDLSDKYESNIYNEFQGEFKVGIFDFDILKDAISRHHIDNEIIMHNLHPHLVLTHVDVVEKADNFPYIKNGMYNELEKDDYGDDWKNAICNMIFSQSSIRYESMYLNASPESNFIQFC